MLVLYKKYLNGILKFTLIKITCLITMYYIFWGAVQYLCDSMQYRGLTDAVQGPNK